MLKESFLLLVTCLDLDTERLVGFIVQGLSGAQGGPIDLEEIMMWVIANEGEGMPVLLVGIRGRQVGHQGASGQILGNV